MNANSKLTDAESVELTKQGYELLCTHGRIIAMLPLGDWLRAIEHAEAAGPFLDPTLYRTYLANPKGQAIKEIIEAALPLKTTIQKWQRILRESAPSADNS